MKGAIAGVELMGKILISVFIIGVIVILFMTFLPNVFQGSFCIDKQRQNINDIFGDAVSKSTTTIRDFTVESCVEYVDFAPVSCKSPGTDDEKRCYEVGFVGGLGKSNCADYNVRLMKPNDDGVWEEVKEKVGDQEVEYCDVHRGQFAPLSGRINTFDVVPCDSCGDNMRYKPGKYAVEVGQYSVKFVVNPDDGKMKEDGKIGG